MFFNMGKKSPTTVKHYLLIGDSENWNVGFSKKIWGFAENTKGLWNTIATGDYVVFYITRPISKVVGYGQITHKFENDSLIWKDEKLFERVIWRYKIKFEIINEIKEWKKGIKLPSTLVLLPSRKSISEELFNSIQRELHNLK